MPVAEARSPQDALDRDGYVVLPGFFADGLRHSLLDRINQLFAEEGDAAGSEFKLEAGCNRLANLADKGDIFQEVIGDERLLQYIEYVLGSEFKVSSVSTQPYAASLVRIISADPNPAGPGIIVVAVDPGRVRLDLDLTGTQSVFDFTRSVEGAEGTP